MFEKVDMLLDGREESSMLEVLDKDIVKHLSNFKMNSTDTFLRQVMKN